MTWSNLSPEMPPAPAEPRQTPTGANFASWVQFLGSALAALMLAGLALLFFVQALILWQAEETDQVTTVILFAVSMGFGGLLTLPSAWFALVRLMGRRPFATLPGGFPRQGVWLFFLLIIEPLALLLGSQLASDNSPITWFFLPPLHLLAVTIPIAWLIHLICYHLPYGVPQRKWGVFASGLILGPAIIIGIEIILGALLIVGVLVALASQPGLLETMERLFAQVSQNPNLLPENIAAELTPFFEKPVVLYAAVMFVVVLVPVFEELLKPIGVWLLAKHSLTPAEGFVAGALNGAGFALMENLGYGAASLSNWATIVLARSGTAIMHIATSAIVGWALCTTWRDGRYRRIVASYLTAVIIHGLWNGITVSFSILGIQTGILTNPITFQALAAGVFGGLLLILLLGINATLRHNEMQRQKYLLAIPKNDPFQPTHFTQGNEDTQYHEAL